MATGAGESHGASARMAGRTWIPDAGLQDRERMHLCCPKSPRWWWFVMKASLERAHLSSSSLSYDPCRYLLTAEPRLQTLDAPRITLPSFAEPNSLH